MTSSKDLLEQELPVMEMFYSIQGEGKHQGMPAYFIRLGGCDVGCHWCDVKESWDAKNHPTLSIDHILKELKKTSAKNIIITGGEPLMYDLTPLTRVLKKEGYLLHLETSGAYPMSGNIDWVCFSPKKFAKPHGDAYEVADELKVVVFNKSDLAWAEQHRAKLNTNARLFLQPEWSKEKELLPLIIDYVKENPEWNISIQTHKYLNIP